MNKRRTVEFLATAGFVGKLPKAPGTWGTLWGIPLGLWLATFGPMIYIVATGAAILLAVVIAQLYETQSGRHDAKEVVIDEVVGYLVTFAMLPPHWTSVVVSFVVFRFFDILKPFPISWLDRNVKGGLGVVIDDVAAGLAGSILLQFMYQIALPRLIAAVPG